MILRLTLFVCGAVVMSLEILASRVLAPAFGDNLQVWGALIGTFIGALSLGYWLGGLASDRCPSMRVMAALIFAAGLLVTVMVPFTRPFNDYLFSLDVQGDHSLWLLPLVSAAVIYGPPSVLLGAVSPWCVKLAASDLARIGARVGGFYAVSSLGSIFGTFFTAFYLIGKLRVSFTIRAEGILLMALSLLLFASTYIYQRKASPSREAA